MPRLVHFELTGPDVPELARFYARILGWRTEPSPFIPDYVLLRPEDDDTPGGAVMSRRYQAQPAILWFEVEDIERSLAGIVDAGGAVMGEKNTIPGEGLVAYAADPAGTVIGLKQPA